MSDQNPTSNLFRPHVKDVQAQQKAAAEHPDSIFGMLTTAALAGMAVCTAGAHAVKQFGSNIQGASMPSAGIEPPASLPKFNTAELRQSANRLRQGAKQLGRSTLEHADDIEQILNENAEEKERKEAEKQKQAMLAAARGQHEAGG